MLKPLSLCVPLSLLLAACGGTTIRWQPSFVSQVPDSTTVRFVAEPGRPPTQGLALDWQRGRPKVITGRDTIAMPAGAALEVRLAGKFGHPTAGGIIGGALGAGVSYSLCPSPKRYCGEQDPTPLLAATVGALIGGRIKTDRWVGVRWDVP
jgi:hypothetical protein